MIEFKNVSKSFGGIKLLDNISFKIQKGERVSLLGPGASGKTTILKMLLGLIKPDSGVISLFGKNVEILSASELQELLKDVGVAFQQGALFDYMTVGENLAFAMKNMRGYDDKKTSKIAKELMTSVKLPHTLDMFPYELSGGMKRRVGIGRCLCTEPVLAIFDEPTSGLDPVTSTIILNMIHELSSKSKDGVQLVVTSSVEIAIRFATRIILINESKVVGDQSWKELLIEGSPWTRYFLGVRLKGIDDSYAKELGLPDKFHEMPLPELKDVIKL